MKPLYLFNSALICNSYLHFDKFLAVSTTTEQLKHKRKCIDENDWQGA